MTESRTAVSSSTWSVVDIVGRRRVSVVSTPVKYCWGSVCGDTILDTLTVGRLLHRPGVVVTRCNGLGWLTKFGRLVGNTVPVGDE